MAGCITAGSLPFCTQRRAGDNSCCTYSPEWLEAVRQCDPAHICKCPPCCPTHPMSPCQPQSSFQRFPSHAVGYVKRRSWGPGWWAEGTKFCKVPASPLSPGLAAPCPSWTLASTMGKGPDNNGPGVGAGCPLVTTSSLSGPGQAALFYPPLAGLDTSLCVL